jgi:hypothetical protein
MQMRPGARVADQTPKIALSRNDSALVCCEPVVTEKHDNAVTPFNRPGTRAFAGALELRMKPHPFIAKVDARWRARRVLRGLALVTQRADNRQYYQWLFDHSFLFPITYSTPNYLSE